MEKSMNLNAMGVVEMNPVFFINLTNDNMLRKLILSLFCISYFVSFAQTFEIKGKVVDEKNQPVPYASLFFVKAQKGTITNHNGNFALNSDTRNDVLKVSCLGYTTVTMKVTTDYDALKIVLKQSATELNEVVVTNLSAAELLKKAIEKIPENYEQQPFLIKWYHRGKMFEKDTLQYFEETYYNIVKSYKSGFKDKYFLEKNRNFQLSNKKGYRHNASFDIVKNATQIFDNTFFKRSEISFLPGTSFDNRSVFVIQCKSIKNEFNSGKIYIDSEDLAFVRFEYYYSRDENSYITNYHKINGKYYLINGHSYHVNERRKNDIPVESDFIVTQIINDFTTDSINGTPIELGEKMIVYQTQEKDSAFWQQHNAILPDSTIQQVISEYQPPQTETQKIDSAHYKVFLKKLYTPNISLFASSDWNKDFYALNQNSVSIGHTVNHFLTKQSRWGILYAYLYDSMQMPFEETIAEQRLLSIDGLHAKMNPFIFNKTGFSYSYGIENSILSNYKTNNYGNFMRLHTIRNDGHYVKAQILEEELAKVTLSNKNNLRDFIQLYFMELFLNKSYTIYNPSGKDKKAFTNAEDKKPLIIDRNRSWVKYLYEPEYEYNRHIAHDKLTKDEQKYLKRSAWFSWINLVSPQMIGIHKFKINKSTEFTFSLNYLRVPFGQMFGQNIWLTTNYGQLHGIYLKQYQNFNKTTFGLTYKLFDLKLFRNAFVTTTLGYWKQPMDNLFYDNKFSDGFHVGQLFEYQMFPEKYTKINRFSLFLGYDFKTKGYMPESYFLDKNFNVKLGFKYLINR
jgi:hypothetical protein